jgi:hypothetical protein
MISSSADRPESTDFVARFIAGMMSSAFSTLSPYPPSASATSSAGQVSLVSLGVTSDSQLVLVLWCVMLTGLASVLNLEIKLKMAFRRRGRRRRRGRLGRRLYGVIRRRRFRDRRGRRIRSPSKYIRGMIRRLRGRRRRRRY